MARTGIFLLVLLKDRLTADALLALYELLAPHDCHVRDDDDDDDDDDVHIHLRFL